MTVAELIEKLKEFPGDLPVTCSNDDGDDYILLPEYAFVYQRDNRTAVNIG